MEPKADDLHYCVHRGCAGGNGGVFVKKCFALGQDNPLGVGGGSVVGNAGQSAIGWCEHKAAGNKCPNNRQTSHEVKK